MFSYLKQLTTDLRSLHARLDRTSTDYEKVLIAQGTTLSAINGPRNISSLQEVEFKVFSQFGEDGILQYLTQNIEIANKTFIEFGVEDFSESNCRFLMLKDNWSGFVMDGSEHNINTLKSASYYWRHDIVAQAAFVTKDNVAKLLEESGFDRDLGILSIDIDGVDYWVAQELKAWRPRILIMEYNAVFGIDRAIVTPYRPDFDRTKAHHSNLYGGASLKALLLLATGWGYEIVGTNSAGNNAFFVRRDLLNARVRALSLAEAFTPSKFRESRDEQGALNFVRGEKRLELIRGLPVFDVESNTMTTI